MWLVEAGTFGVTTRRCSEMVRKHQREADIRRDTRARKNNEGRSKQPRPKVPLLSKGKDPTLAERFEEELQGSPEAG